MWDQTLPSDYDVQEMTPEQLEYRQNIVSDLEASFHEDMWLSGVSGLLIPILWTASIFFDWVDGDGILWSFAFASVLTIGAFGIWLHSIYWHRRFDHRLKIIQARIRA